MEEAEAEKESKKSWHARVTLKMRNLIGEDVSEYPFVYRISCYLVTF